MMGVRSVFIIASVGSFIAGTFVASPELRAYAANTIFSTDIVDGEVKTADLATGSVTNPKLAANSVSTTKIGTGAVTNSKIGTEAVSASKLGPNAILSGKIKDGEVTSADIANGTILGTDTSPSFMERVTLFDGAPGWNPDGSETIFGIYDSSVESIDNTIVILNLVDPAGAPICGVYDIFLGGFSFTCERGPADGTELHYSIINIPSSGLISSVGAASNSR